MATLPQPPVAREEAEAVAEAMESWDVGFERRPLVAALADTVARLVDRDVAAAIAEKEKEAGAEAPLLDPAWAEALQESIVATHSAAATDAAQRLLAAAVDEVPGALCGDGSWVPVAEAPADGGTPRTPPDGDVFTVGGPEDSVLFGDSFDGPPGLAGFRDVHAALCAIAGVEEERPAMPWADAASNSDSSAPALPLPPGRVLALLEAIPADDAMGSAHWAAVCAAVASLLGAGVPPSRVTSPCGSLRTSLQLSPLPVADIDPRGSLPSRPSALPSPAKHGLSVLSAATSAGCDTTDDHDTDEAALVRLAHLAAAGSGEQLAHCVELLAAHAAGLPPPDPSLGAKLTVLWRLLLDLPDHWLWLLPAAEARVCAAVLRVVAAHGFGLSVVDPYASWAEAWARNFSCRAAMSAALGEEVEPGATGTDVVFRMARQGSSHGVCLLLLLAAPADAAAMAADHLRRCVLESAPHGSPPALDPTLCPLLAARVALDAKAPEQAAVRQAVWAAVETIPCPEDAAVLRTVDKALSGAPARSLPATAVELVAAVADTESAEWATPAALRRAIASLCATRDGFEALLRECDTALADDSRHGVVLPWGALAGVLAGPHDEACAAMETACAPAAADDLRRTGLDALRALALLLGGPLHCAPGRLQDLLAPGVARASGAPQDDALLLPADLARALALHAVCCAHPTAAAAPGIAAEASALHEAARVVPFPSDAALSSGDVSPSRPASASDAGAAALCPATVAALCLMLVCRAPGHSTDRVVPWDVVAALTCHGDEANVDPATLPRCAQPSAGLASFFPPPAALPACTAGACIEDAAGAVVTSPAAVPAAAVAIVRGALTTSGVLPGPAPPLLLACAEYFGGLSDGGNAAWVAAAEVLFDGSGPAASWAAAAVAVVAAHPGGVASSRGAEEVEGAAQRLAALSVLHCRDTSGGVQELFASAVRRHCPTAEGAVERAGLSLEYLLSRWLSQGFVGALCRGDAALLPLLVAAGPESLGCSHSGESPAVEAARMVAACAAVAMGAAWDSGWLLRPADRCPLLDPPVGTLPGSAERAAASRVEAVVVAQHALFVPLLATRLLADPFPAPALAPRMTELRTVLASL